MTVGVLEMDDTAEHANWRPVATIQKWDDETDWVDAKPPNRVEVYEGNVLLNAGITRLLNLLVGAGGTAFNATNTRLGVGDSSTAATASQTDVQAATNKQWVLVDSAPSVSSQTATFIATFTATLGNFVWAEWAIDNGTANGTTVTAPCLDRKVAAMGTKANPAVWVLTVTITIS